MLRNPQNPLEETGALSDLKEAFVESNLPIRVYIMDWARIPVSFHREIERAHVMVQEGASETEPKKKRPIGFAPWKEK